MNSGPKRSRFWRCTIRAKAGGDVVITGVLAVGASRCRPAKSSRRLFMCCAPAASGKRCQRTLAVPAPSTRTSSAGGTTGFSCGCGKRGWRNTTRWKELLGLGKVSTVPWAKPHSRKKPWDPIQRIRGKKGTKRSLLVDGAGAPLSLIVSGANRHDVKLLDVTLDGIVISRPKPTRRRPQHLCADKAYQGKPAQAIIIQRGYIPHVRQIRDETKAKRHGQPARRWVVERSHSWFNRFRKLLVRYEKKEANYLALTHCAAAMICFRMA